MKYWYKNIDYKDLVELSIELNISLDELAENFAKDFLYRGIVCFYDTIPIYDCGLLYSKGCNSDIVVDRLYKYIAGVFHKKYGIYEDENEVIFRTLKSIKNYTLGNFYKFIGKSLALNFISVKRLNRNKVLITHEENYEILDENSFSEVNFDMFIYALDISLDEKTLLKDIFFFNKTNKEIGIKLGLTPDAIQKRKKVLLLKIKNLLNLENFSCILDINMI